MTTTDEQENLVAAALQAVEQPTASSTNENSKAPPTFKKTSPTLSELEDGRHPQASTACEHCPHSVWFSTPKELQCYCRVMYLIAWRSAEPQQITLCDGVFLK